MMDSPRRDRQRISIQVEEQKLYLTVPAVQESHFRQAGEELRQTTQLYRAKYPNESEVSPMGYIAMAALDIAYRAELAKAELETRDLGVQLRALNDSVEEILASCSASLRSDSQ